jgi:serine/threonine protein kinase
MIRGMEGTPSYMSPEMRRGHYYDRKTDIWSLGVALLIILFYDNATFPNFELEGSNAAKRFAEERDYLSEDMQLFMSSLFIKANSRPSARQLLQVCMVRQNLT